MENKEFNNHNKEFKLKDERKKLFDKFIPNFVSHKDKSLFITIRYEIEEQDKEFIKRLKSEIFKQEMKPQYSLYYCDLDTIIDKLTGFEDKGDLAK